jgi:Leucine-rich repeat (LRR) protein
VFFLLLATAKIKSENVTIECTFIHHRINYEGVLENITISDAEGVNIIVGGIHSSGRSNVHVNTLRVINSSIPFVITQAFATCPYLELYDVDSGGLSSIQPYSVKSGSRFSNFWVHNNPQLTSISPYAFSAGTNMEQLMLQNCALSEVHELAFIGLSNVYLLDLTNNKIRSLSSNVFRSLRRVL